MLKVPWTPTFILLMLLIFREKIRQMNYGEIIILLVILYFTFTALEIVIKTAAQSAENAEDGKVHYAPPSRPRFAGGYYGSPPDENP